MSTAAETSPSGPPGLTGWFGSHHMLELDFWRDIIVPERPPFAPGRWWQF